MTAQKVQYELCCLCDDMTGRAGRGDDSLYCTCGCGPFCVECYNEEPCPNCGEVEKDEE